MKRLIGLLLLAGAIAFIFYLVDSTFEELKARRSSTIEAPQ